MKCSEIIVEDISSLDANVIVRHLVKNCKPYFKLNPFNVPLWRGITHKMEQIVPGFYLDYSVSDRPPRDTSEHIHQAIDNWFEKHFGIRFRSDNVIFTTGHRQYAKDFSKHKEPMRVFPIGNFNFLWSYMYSDLFTRFPYGSSRIDDDILDQIMSRGDFKFNSDFNGALASGHEIMIKCSKYYALDCSDQEYRDIVDKVVKFLSTSIRL